MLRSILMTGALALTATTAATANAASADYFLKIDGIDGEAQAEGWSFGACNAGCMASSTKRDGAAPPQRLTGPLQASQNSQSLRESPTRASHVHGSATDPATETASRGRGGKDRASMSDLSVTREASASAGGVNVAAGDVDGDGRADLVYAAQLDGIEGLTLRFDKESPVLAKVCSGKHIAKAVLRAGADEFELTGASAACDSGARSSALASSMPNRISMNMSVPRQTQGASFGERCAPGTCAADATVFVTLTGGQMKHTRTGHVTLMK
ncbi:MAG: FG-GAP repeat protein [Novosphingobium sp.]|nr:FG-GAP repeat protein [Novosphingobium sp.]